MVSGDPPFFGESEESIKDKIQNIDIPIKTNLSLNTKDLLHRLLCRDPNNRLCSKEGAVEIKKHPFFSSINWDHLIKNIGISTYNLLSKEEEAPSMEPTELLPNSFKNLTYTQTPQVSPSMNSSKSSSKLEVSPEFAQF